jgi:hypothetical protein
MIFLLSTAFAQIAPECEDAAAQPPPDWYVDDQHQQDFLLNYFSLSTTLSPLHGAVALPPGRGSLGVDISIIPPLSCDRRLVLDRSKTEDTNKTPAAPRLRALFAAPKLGPAVVYGGLAYIPPVTVFGTRNVIASGELGVGFPIKKGPEFGLRYHFTLLKTIGEIATPFNEEEEAINDLYVGSTFGLDAIGSYRMGHFVPYVALGFTDASTYFWIGDDGIVSNNLTPYAGFTGSLGVQMTWKWLDAAAEFYTAPGYLYTGRLKFAYLF